MSVEEEIKIFMDYIAITTDNYIEHHGILGQKWGIRRYQNKDGSLTEAGLKKRSGDLARADERLKNRSEYVTKKSDEVKNAARLGTMRNIRGSANLSYDNKKVRDLIKYLNENEDKKEKFGRITHDQRVATVAGTTAGALGSAAVVGYLAAAAGSGLATIPIAALPAAAIAAGGAYIYSLTKR